MDFSSLSKNGTTDTAVSIIIEYIQEHLFAPELTWPRYEFMKRTYQQWAACEICEQILDHPMQKPIEIIEKFYHDMIRYRFNYGDDDDDRNFIFQTAAETAEELILLFV